MISTTNFHLLADLPPSSGYTRNFSYCIKITNLSEYSDYLFFFKIKSANPNLPTSDYIQIKENQCFSLQGYRPIAEIGAILSEEVKPSDLIQNNEVSLKNISLEQKLNQNSSDIPHPYSLPSIYSGQEVKDSFKITSVSTENITLLKVDREPKITQFFNWFAFPILGLILIAWLLWRRKKHKNQNHEVIPKN